MNQEFSCSDKEMLIAYIYGECDADDRRRVEAHLASCAACADEVGGLASVRQTLAGWVPSAASPGFRIVREEDAVPAAATVLRPARWWRQPLPAWARAAAAVVLFAGGAALANLDVHYGSDGFTVRTGWQHPGAVAQQPAQSAQVVPTAAAPAPTPWRTDLAALERQLRGDFAAQLQSLQATAPQAVAARSQDDRQLMTRVRSLIDESEQRQQREMAYRISQVQGEFGVQRRADLLRMQAGLGQIQGQTGEEVLRQRQLINYLLTVSQKK